MVWSAAPCLRHHEGGRGRDEDRKQEPTPRPDVGYWGNASMNLWGKQLKQLDIV